MLILWLSLFIGAIQCGAEDTTTLSPHQFNNLDIPDPNEYVSIYILSVQTAYITSVECMLSSDHYIKSGFDYIDSESTNFVNQIKNGIQNLLSQLQSDQDQEIKSKLDAVLFMTVNYYKKQNLVVPETEVQLSDLTDIIDAQSVLVAQRCESSYLDYMAEIQMIKETYATEMGIMDYKHFSQKDWLVIVNQYNEANDKVLNKTNAYAGIRDAFLLGIGINVCKTSIDINKKILDIYNCDDLSSFFGGIHNNVSLLFHKTVTYMYSIYKNALTVIYLNSICYSRQHMALRIMMWEQLNLVRANFEFMCQHIITFIHEVEANAESQFGKESDEYNQVMTVLQSTVNRMLITAILSTSVHYQRALEFSSDGNMIQNNYNKYSRDELSKYYDKILWKISDVRSFDMRVINQETSSYPSIDMSIPNNMYSLTINKLVFQAFICQVNYITSKMQQMENDNTDASAWLFTQITLKEMEYSIISAKCSAVGNKMYSINAATYAYYIMLAQATNAQIKETTQSSSEFKQSESNDFLDNSDIIKVPAFMDNISNDIIGVLCVHSVDIVKTFHEVEIYINQNTKTTASSTNYQPKITSYNSGNYGTSPSTQQNTAYLGAQSNNISSDEISAVGDDDIGSYDTSSSNTFTPLDEVQVSNNNNLSGTSGDMTASTMEMESSIKELASEETYNSITSITQITDRLQYFQTSVTLEFSSCMTLVQSVTETDYTKLVLVSLQSSQDQFNINYVYLNIIVSESEKFINQHTAPDSSEYFTAVTALYRDTMEKQMILGSLVEAPLSRANDFRLDSQYYLYVSQTIEYTLFVQKCYEYFGVDYTQLYDSNNNAKLFVTKSISVFTEIHEAVMNAVQQTNENPHKKFLKWYLELILIAFQMTCESIKTQITQSQNFISQSRENSQIAFYKEIILRVETVQAIYFATLIKCHEYSVGKSSVSIFQSDYDVVVSQLSFST